MTTPYFSQILWGPWPRVLGALASGDELTGLLRRSQDLRLEGQILVTLRATVEGEDGIQRRKFSGALGANFDMLHGIGIKHLHFPTFHLNLWQM